MILLYILTSSRPLRLSAFVKNVKPDSSKALSRTNLADGIPDLNNVMKTHTPHYIYLKVNIQLNLFIIELI